MNRRSIPVAGSPVPRQLVWHSDAALQRQADVLKGRLQAWATEWDLQVSVSCTNAWAAAGQIDPDAPWQTLLRTSAGTPCVFVRGQSQLDAAVDIRRATCGDHHDGAADTAAGPIAASVGMAALQALASHLARTLDLLPCEACVPISQGDLRRWSGATRVELELRGVQSARLFLHLSADVRIEVADIGVTATSKRTPLAPLSTVLGSRPLAMSAWLQPTAVSLRELIGLQVGDVIVTAHALERPLQVAVDASPGAEPNPLCRGAVGMRDGCCAVSLIPADASE